MSIVWVKRSGGPGSQRLNSFLQKFAENISICAQTYHEEFVREFEYSSYPLLGRERQIYSLLSVAMHKLTVIHQSETGITRRRDLRIRQNKGRKKSGKGRVDLWSYNDGVEYFFEFKRSFISIASVKNGTIIADIRKNWKSINRQVEEVKSGVLEEYGYYELPVYFIGLHIITAYRSSSNEDLLLERTSIADKTIKQWMENLDPVPHAALCYRTDDKMSKNPIKWTDDGSEEKMWELHPCHLFCFTILQGDS